MEKWTEMMRKKSGIAALHTIPADVLEILGPPPILATEDAHVYYTMLTIFVRSIRPDDLITWMLVKDLADHRVEIARYRRMKAGIIAASRRKTVETQVSSWRSYGKNRARDLTNEAARQKELLAKSNKPAEEIDKLKAEIESKLAADIAEEEATGRTQLEVWKNLPTTESDYVSLFDTWIANVERIDVLLRAAEERFSVTLEEIDHHVRGLGQFLREQLDKVIDGDFTQSQEADRELSEGAAEPKSVSNDANAKGRLPTVSTGSARLHSTHVRRTEHADSSARTRPLLRGRR